MNKKVLAAELLKIKEKYGKEQLRPADVVREARNKVHPLHKYFEWDDSEAAAAYRLAQARDLIRTCVVYIEDHQEPVNVFVSLKSDRVKGDGYRVLSEVLSDADMRRELMSNALEDLRYFESKYKQLQDISAVKKNIRTAIEALEGEVAAT